jgi:hypothetical protein
VPAGAFGKRKHPPSSSVVDPDADDTPIIKPAFEDYVLLGSEGGRGGLPEVRLSVKREQSSMFLQGAPYWLDEAGVEPEDMHYSGWNFWQTGVWGALKQLVYEQATDHEGKAAKLGRYHVKLKGTSVFCWSNKKDPLTGLVLNLDDGKGSARLRHYVTYGKENHLYFNGNARVLITVDKNRQVKVNVMSSSMPEQATSNLKTAIEGLSSHPVLSFPASQPADKIELMAEFNITRKPGDLLIADQ